MTQSVGRQHIHVASPATLPPIPKSVIMKDGQNVRLKGSVWRFKVNVKLESTFIINWPLLQNVLVNGSERRVLSDRAIYLVMLYIAAALRKSSASTIKLHYYAFLRFARWLAMNKKWLPPDRGFEWLDLTEGCFDAWLQAEYKTPCKGRAPSSLRVFYCWGANPDTQFRDFSERLAQTLNNKRIQAHHGSEAVVSRDSRRGPFNMEEVIQILNACESGKGSDQDRALAWLLLDTGMRPTQAALLRNCDLQVFDEEDHEAPSESSHGGTNSAYQLRVRIIKRPYAEEEYRLLPISRGCGQLLDQLRKSGGEMNGPLLYWLGKSYLDGMHRRLKCFFEDADLRSSRLPVANPDLSGPKHEIMPSNPQRFRYTLASGRVAMRDSPENVSDFLCQSNPSSLRPYVETSPLIADDFQRATDHAVAPLIGRMQGRLDDPRNPSAAPIIPGVVPQSSPRRELRVIGPIGKCDAGGSCPRNPVTGCFGCPSFIARPDAPLRELRAAILGDMEADLAESASPEIVGLMRSTLRELDEWIEHIDRAKAVASLPQAAR